LNANANRHFYRLNYQITAPQLRLLDEEGKQIGVVGKLEALQKAKELMVDIVEIAPNANPPVAKLIDYKKFRYQEAKKDRESRKSQKNVSVKEIRLRPFIGTHDFDTRVAQAKEFLSGGNQVKITLAFKGREITRKEFGFAVIKRFIASLESVKVVREPKVIGRFIDAMIVNDKKGSV
jgi:translation initiation factor IF-3